MIRRLLAKESKKSDVFIKHGLLLFLDSVILAVAGWLFWLFVSRFATASEIGSATSVISLVVLATGLAQLGFEYPLLKRASSEGAKLLGTTLLMELILNLIAFPFIVYTLSSIYSNDLKQFTPIALGIFLLNSVWFVIRYSLIGMGQMKDIFLSDLVGTIAKFLVVFVFLTWNQIILGILISFLSQYLVNVIWLSFTAARNIGYSYGGKKYGRVILKEGLANTPSKISRLVIIGLSVVILTFYGIDASSIGVYYMALTLTVMAGSLGANIALTVIPASSTSTPDLSLTGIRFSLSLSAPMIVALVVVPGPILALLGPDYALRSDILIILALTVFPSIIVLHTISNLNNSNQIRKLLLLGLIEVITYLSAALVLIPLYNVMGASLAILIAFVASAIPSILWHDRLLIRYGSICIIAIVVGWLTGHILYNLSANTIAILVSSVAASFLVVLSSKNIRISELSQLLCYIIKRPGVR